MYVLCIVVCTCYVVCCVVWYVHTYVVCTVPDSLVVLGTFKSKSILTQTRRYPINSMRLFLGINQIKHHHVGQPLPLLLPLPFPLLLPLPFPLLPPSLSSFSLSLSLSFSFLPLLLLSPSPSSSPSSFSLSLSTLPI